MKGAYRPPTKSLRDETGVQTDVKRGAADENRDATCLNRYRARHRTRGQFGAANRERGASQSGNRANRCRDVASKPIIGYNWAGKSCLSHHRTPFKCWYFNASLRTELMSAPSLLARSAYVRLGLSTINFILATNFGSE